MLDECDECGAKYSDNTKYLPRKNICGIYSYTGLLRERLPVLHEALPIWLCWPQRTTPITSTNIGKWNQRSGSVMTYDRFVMSSDTARPKLADLSISDGASVWIGQPKSSQAYKVEIRGRRKNHQSTPHVYNTECIPTWKQDRPRASVACQPAYKRLSGWPSPSCCTAACSRSCCWADAFARQWPISTNCCTTSPPPNYERTLTCTIWDHDIRPHSYDLGEQGNSDLQQ